MRGQLRTAALALGGKLAGLALAGAFVVTLVV
jgi:hypothetical protein